MKLSIIIKPFFYWSADYPTAKYNITVYSVVPAKYMNFTLPLFYITLHNSHLDINN